MTASSSLIAPHLHAFFTTYLGQHKRASPQTVASCRDTFRLLLLFIKDTKQIEPSALGLTELDVPTILAFLTHLLAIRPISFQYCEFQAVDRETCATPAVAGCPAATLIRASAVAGCPLLQQF